MEFYSNEDVAGWLASEKLDGVFARRSGGFLWSRDWVILPAPARLSSGDGNTEGEIWHPAGLERVQGCRSWGENDARWDGVQFVPHATIPATPVSGAVEAFEMMRAVVARGGEGIVLRCPKTGAMLKMKPSHDTEAEVVGYTEGSGRNRGVGSLVLLGDCGKFRLSVGLSSRDRVTPPPIGSLVTYSFDGMTANGLPRNARFMRVRLAP